jgi:hypothetical protein
VDVQQGAQFYQELLGQKVSDALREWFQFLLEHQGLVALDLTQEQGLQLV